MVVATLTNYDAECKLFDALAVKVEMDAARAANLEVWIVAELIVLVSHTERICEERADDRAIYSPEFL